MINWFYGTTETKSSPVILVPSSKTPCNTANVFASDNSKADVSNWTIRSWSPSPSISTRLPIWPLLPFCRATDPVKERWKLSSKERRKFSSHIVGLLAFSRLLLTYSFPHLIWHDRHEPAWRQAGNCQFEVIFWSLHRWSNPKTVSVFWHEKSKCRDCSSTNKWAESCYLAEWCGPVCGLMGG